MKDYYEILNVKDDGLYDIKTVTLNMLKIAYYEGTEEDLQEIAEAYVVLSNPKEKKRYETARANNQEYDFKDRLPSTHNPEEVLNKMKKRLWSMKTSYRNKIKTGLVLLGVGLIAWAIAAFNYFYIGYTYEYWKISYVGDACILGGLGFLLPGIKEKIFFKKEAWYYIDID